MPVEPGVVTIDGPSGAGKSTISRMLASRLAFTYLDTGAMYRAVGLGLARLGVDPEDDQALAAGLEGLRLELAPAAKADDDVVVRLNGEDISAAIRTPEMGLVASKISAYPLVRERLTQLQRDIAARSRGLVAEGRDMGTVVFPRARYKFYLDATPAERARRRCEQLGQRGEKVDEEEILRQIEERDQADSRRALAPLRPAEDAVIIDSTGLDPQGVVEAMLTTLEH